LPNFIPTTDSTAARPLTTHESLEMTELNRIEVLEHFIGKQNIVDTRWSKGYINFEAHSPIKTTGTTIRSIKDSDLDDIKDIFTGVLRSRPFTDRLLWLLWVREVKLNLGALKEEDMLSFVHCAYVLDNDKIDIDKIVRGFDTLEQKEYLLKVSIDCREYPLTPPGKEIAEKMFVKMKDGRFAYIESPPIVSEDGIADLPRMTQAASGRGNPKSAVEAAYQESIEWADEPADVNLKKIDPAEREALGESIGRSAAKWLLKADMSKTNRELQEEVLSDMGFAPVEVTEKLYPNASESERRKASQRISKNNSKRNKTS